MALYNLIMRHNQTFQGRQYIVPDKDETERDADEDEKSCRIFYEERYHDDRQDDFLNGKVMMQ